MGLLSKQGGSWLLRGLSYYFINEALRAPDAIHHVGCCLFVFCVGVSGSASTRRRNVLRGGLSLMMCCVASEALRALNTIYLVGCHQTCVWRSRAKLRKPSTMLLQAFGQARSEVRAAGLETGSTHEQCPDVADPGSQRPRQQNLHFTFCMSPTSALLSHTAADAPVGAPQRPAPGAMGPPAAAPRAGPPGGRLQQPGDRGPGLCAGGAGEGMLGVDHVHIHSLMIGHYNADVKG